MEKENKNGLIERYLWVLLLVTFVVMFIPWLGDSLFNTKGEPREAIVAQAMVNSGDWVLPVSFNYEIPYKPPFLAWCIAALSYLTGGIGEFTSRLPSALAAIALAMSTYFFFARHSKSKLIGAFTAVVFVTSIEVWRAASACRVDMLNTAFMVGALYSMYNFFENKCRGGLPWIAILLMSCSFLTKGPVGMVLPCLVVGVYRLLRGDKFWGLFGRIAAAGVLSCVLPAMWYYAAYVRGGQEFADLMIEENIGRLTGGMSYESHVNPFYYNFITMFAGMLPYTLLALGALFIVKWGKLKFAGMATVRSTWQKLLKLDPVTLFSVVTTVIIFVFYCIPKSKRSVYLLPIYPFLAYFVTLLIIRLVGQGSKVQRCYNWMIAVLAIVLPLVAILAFGMKIGPLAGLQGKMPGIVAGIVLSVTLFYGVVMVRRMFSHSLRSTTIMALTATVLTLTSLSAALLPPILSSKSDAPVAHEIMADYPKGELFSYVNDPYLRLYEINFYMNDRLRLFDKEFERGTLPDRGIVLLKEEDFDAFVTNYSPEFEIFTVRDYVKPNPILAKPKHLTTRLLTFRRK